MAIVVDRNRPQKHVERARIVLGSADQAAAQHVVQRIGVSRPAPWRWQQRCAEAGSRVCCARQDPPVAHPGAAGHRARQTRGQDVERSAGSSKTNDDPKPFVWTADPDKIIAAVKRTH
jgi:hypothetical protein